MGKGIRVGFCHPFLTAESGNTQFSSDLGRTSTVNSLPVAYTQVLVTNRALAPDFQHLL